MKAIPYYHVDVFTEHPFSGNGLIVFTETENLTKADMQKLTQEMRQFESIFLRIDATGNRIRAFVFTCEEELDFAGHPVLGAAAVLHDLFSPKEQKAKWHFILNEKEVEVFTNCKNTGYEAFMHQGKAEFGRLLTTEEAKMILPSLNLKEDDLYPGLLPMVVSTGLPYLLVPLQRNGLNAQIKVTDLAEKIGKFGARFIGTIQIPTKEIRTWDNIGSVEDIATGSLAGPAGAYLVSQGFEKCNTIIQLNQGAHLGRKSQLFVEVKTNAENRYEVVVSGNVCKVSSGLLDESLFA